MRKILITGDMPTQHMKLARRHAIHFAHMYVRIHNREPIMPPRKREIPQQQAITFEDLQYFLTACGYTSTLRSLQYTKRSTCAAALVKVQIQHDG